MAEFGAPQSRNESILQNMLGADNVLVPPESRIEDLLIQILNQGGGGGGGGEDNVFVASYGTTALRMRLLPVAPLSASRSVREQLSGEDQRLLGRRVRRNQ